MTPEQKEHNKKLVEALRSGEYQQVQGRLRVTKEIMKQYPGTFDSTGFCCLGVACDLAAKDGVGAWADGRFEVAGEDGDIHVPPEAIWKDYYGWNYSNPALIEDLGTSREEAACLNDHYDWDFNQLADAFERTFLQEETDASADAESLES